MIQLLQIVGCLSVQVISCYELISFIIISIDIIILIITYLDIRRYLVDDLLWSSLKLERKYGSQPLPMIQRTCLIWHPYCMSQVFVVTDSSSLSDFWFESHCDCQILISCLTRFLILDNPFILVPAILLSILVVMLLECTSNRHCIMYVDTNYQLDQNNFVSGEFDISTK